MVRVGATVRYTSACVLAIVGFIFPAATAEARGVSREQHMTSVTQMMTALAPQSALAAAMIRGLYGPYLDFLVLNGYDQIEGALGNGGLVPLPDPQRFNVVPRLEGLHAIGEKDPDNQASYLSARAATIGCLLQLASRVKSGPIEVTSLVRHSEYQDALRVTNINANPTVPMHTMGLAFDIAIVNTSLETVLEIRNVLQEMQKAGDILFIAERRQLVFHVVPHPSRLGYFTEVYARALETGRPSATPLDIARPLVPRVTTAITSLWPTPEHAAEWWESDSFAVDLTVAVTPELPADLVDQPSAGGFAGYFVRFGEIMASTWARMTRVFSSAAVS
jgi:hypothetical protein